MAQVLEFEAVRAMLIAVADKVMESKDYLTQIDNAIGDGDHGTGMSSGMQKAKKKLEDMQDTDNVYLPFEAAGKTMLMSMGGASGVLFGSLFLAGAKKKPPQPQMNTAEMAELFANGLDEVKSRGKAQVGDKTMVDALEPAVLAMRQHAEEGFHKMLLSAEKAAQDGVESTKNMVAKFGRAKFLMERVIGHQDAGATSVLIIFQAMREFMEQFEAGNQ